MQIEKDQDGWNVLDGGGNVMARCPVQADAKQILRGLEVLDEAQKLVSSDEFDEDADLTEIMVSSLCTGKPPLKDALKQIIEEATDIGGAMSEMFPQEEWRGCEGPVETFPPVFTSLTSMRHSVVGRPGSGMARPLKRPRALFRTYQTIITRVTTV